MQARQEPVEFKYYPTEQLETHVSYPLFGSVVNVDPLKHDEH